MQYGIRSLDGPLPDGGLLGRRRGRRKIIGNRGHLGDGIYALGLRILVIHEVAEREIQIDGHILRGIGCNQFVIEHEYAVGSIFEELQRALYERDEFGFCLLEAGNRGEGDIEPLHVELLYKAFDLIGDIFRCSDNHRIA